MPVTSVITHASRGIQSMPSDRNLVAASRQRHAIAISALVDPALHVTETFVDEIALLHHLLVRRPMKLPNASPARHQAASPMAVSCSSTLVQRQTLWVTKAERLNNAVWIHGWPHFYRLQCCCWGAKRSLLWSASVAAAASSEANSRETAPSVKRFV
jgi:hypothetical protein